MSQNINMADIAKALGISKVSQLRGILPEPGAATRAATALQRDARIGQA